MVRLSALPCVVAAIALGSLAPGAAAQPPADRNYRPGIDVLDYDLTLDLPSSGKRIAGRAVLTVRRTAPVDTLVLDLLGMQVDSVLVDGRATMFRRDDTTLRVALPARDTARVAVRYGGEPADGLIIGTDSAGRWMAFGDNWPDRVRNWIPSVDHPSDKATVSWTIRAPSGLTVIANGAPAGTTPIDGGSRTETRWRENKPVPSYVMVIAAAPLVRVDLGETACGLGEATRCVTQSVYVMPEHRDYVPGPFADAPAIVEFFSRLVAPFPYEKLSHLESSTRFGGMENSSAIFYPDRAFKRRTMAVPLIAHETAHQWFGDAVTEREWGHLWLSEGFASYWAPLWQQHASGDSAFRATMARIRDEVIKSPVTLARPAIDTTQAKYMELLNTNSYQKGAWTLHMLRGIVGDSAFFRGVREYYLAHRHGNALTDDLRQAIEHTSGQSLAWFFDQWLRRPGYAELTSSWRYDAAKRRVSITIEQGERFAPYRFPLTVDVTAADGHVHRATVEIPAERTTTIVIPVELGTAPRGVDFDPRVELLATIRPR